MELTITHPEPGINCINNTGDFWFFTYENTDLLIDITSIDVPIGKDTKVVTESDIYGATTEQECIDKKAELGL